jgi:nucleotide-binding universal stress UspA family protein
VAVALAVKLGARVSVFYALPTAEGFSLSALPPFVDRTTFSKKRIGEIHEVIAEQAKRYLQGAIARPQPRDGMGTVVDMDWEYQESDHPYLAILTGAKQLGCDLIVMASHGRRGLEGSMLGSQTQKVLNHSTIPVLVVPPEVAIN